MDAAAEALPGVLDAARDDGASAMETLEALLGIQVSATETRQQASRLHFANLQRVQGDLGAGLGVVQAADHRTGPPAQYPHVIQPEHAGGLAGRPVALPGGMLDQLQQTGLDVGVHSRRDQAGVQPQSDFP